LEAYDDEEGPMLNFKQDVFEELSNGLLGHRAIVEYDFVLLIANLTLFHYHLKSPMLFVFHYHQLPTAAIVANSEVSIDQISRVLQVLDPLAHDGRPDIYLDDLDVAETEVTHHCINHRLIGFLRGGSVTQHQGDLLKGHE
jgi:hypothetical protein